MTLTVRRLGAAGEVRVVRMGAAEVRVDHESVGAVAPPHDRTVRPSVPLAGFVDERRPWWHALAACRGVGPELFFPPPGVPLEPARRYCRGCAVLDVCADYAIEAEERFGVWGALSGKARKERRKRRETS